jgi:hypothetical protein
VRDVDHDRAARDGSDGFETDLGVEAFASASPLPMVMSERTDSLDILSRSGPGGHGQWDGATHGVTDPPVPIDPAGLFAKGAERSFTFGPPLLLQLRARKQGTSDLIASSPMAELVVSHRYEFILVGSRARNARIVLLDRVVSQTSP